MRKFLFHDGPKEDKVKLMVRWNTWEMLVYSVAEIDMEELKPGIT